jgi:hypothetical protein
MFAVLIILFCVAYAVLAAVVAAGAVIAFIVIFCRAKGTWRERIRDNFGRGT